MYETVRGVSVYMKIPSWGLMMAGARPAVQSHVHTDESDMTDVPGIPRRSKAKHPFKLILSHDLKLTFQSWSPLDLLEHGSDTSSVTYIE
jgi:hypothetical protein